MAYNDSTDSGAMDETGPEEHSAAMHEGDGGGEDNIFYLPPDFVYGKDGAKCKPGDKIILTVAGDADDDGDIPVKMERKEHQGGGDGKKPFMDDLRESMTAPATPEGEA